MEFYKSKYSDGKTDGRDARRENKSYRSFRNSGDDRSRDNDREDTTVTCSDCGTECTVPFVQELTNLFTVVIVLDNTNQTIQEVIDQEMIEVHDIQEMIDQEIMIEKILR